MRKYLLAVVPAIFFLTGCGPTNSQLESRATQEFASNLKDPGSAQFRNLYLHQVKASGLSKSAYVCGEVNAKNDFGAYVGYSRFYIHIEADTRFLIPFLGIAHGESDPGIVDENSDMQDKLASLEEYQKRCG